MSKIDKKLIVECFGTFSKHEKDFYKALEAAVNEGYYELSEVKDHLTELFFVVRYTDEEGERHLKIDPSLIKTAKGLRGIESNKPLFNQYQIGKAQVSELDLKYINKLSPIKRDAVAKRIRPLSYTELMDHLRDALKATSRGYNAFFLLTREGQDESKLVEKADFALVAVKQNRKYTIMTKKEYLDYMIKYRADAKQTAEDSKMAYYGDTYMYKIDPNEDSHIMDMMNIYRELHMEVDLPELPIIDHGDTIDQFDKYISGYEGFYTYAGSDNSHYVPGGRKSHATMYKKDRLSKVSKDEFYANMALAQWIKVYRTQLSPEDIDLFEDLDMADCPCCGKRIRQSSEYCPYCWVEIENPFHDMDPNWIRVDGKDFYDFCEDDMESDYYEDESYFDEYDEFEE